jgi:hypothetical protein
MLHGWSLEGVWLSAQPPPAMQVVRRAVGQRRRATYRVRRRAWQTIDPPDMMGVGVAARQLVDRGIGPSNNLSGDF